ncbi:MAG: hypothetical protein RLP09_10160 [Sandaracinaceae bacterium]
MGKTTQSAKNTVMRGTKKAGVAVEKTGDAAASVVKGATRTAQRGVKKATNTVKRGSRKA